MIEHFCFIPLLCFDSLYLTGYRVTSILLHWGDAVTAHLIQFDITLNSIMLKGKKNPEILFLHHNNLKFIFDILYDMHT
jgi:hypothetical protein